MATCGNKRQPSAPSQIQSSAVGVATVATSFARRQRRRWPSGKAVAGVAIVAALMNMGTSKPVGRNGHAAICHWGPSVNPDQLKAMQRELLEVVAGLAKLERWDDSAALRSMQHMT